MNQKLKNRLLYWALSIVPFVAAVIFAEAFIFFLFLIAYILTYRPLIDSQRLISLGVIEEKDAWKFFVPFYIDKTRYIKPLWLG